MDLRWLAFAATASFSPMRPWSLSSPAHASKDWFVASLMTGLALPRLAPGLRFSTELLYLPGRSSTGKLGRRGDAALEEALPLPAEA